MGKPTWRYEFLYVEKIRLYRSSMVLRKPFRIAYGETRVARSVFVEVVLDNGVTGWGEAPPTARITGETLGTVVGAIKFLADHLVGVDVLGYKEAYKVIDSVLRGNSAAKNALTMAIMDAVGKSLKMPVYRLLGGSQDVIVTDSTIGLDYPDKMADEAAEWVGRGFRSIKIKLGGPLAVDFERVRRVREAIGPNIELRVDANQAWTPKEAVRAVEVLEKYDVSVVEQPVYYKDYSGLKFVRDRSSIPIIADESVHTSKDAALLASMEAVDGLNIKLAKSGGIIEGLKIASIAEAFNLELMVGCMLESPLAIAAAAHMVSAHGGFKYVDLDSDMALVNHPVTNYFERRKDEIILKDTPGLGVEVDAKSLEFIEEYTPGGAEKSI